MSYLLSLTIAIMKRKKIEIGKKAIKNKLKSVFPRQPIIELFLFLLIVK